MMLLHITTPDAGLPAGVGALPGGGAEHRLVLDPASSFGGAVAAVADSLRQFRTAWIVVAGRAVAPFLTAVAADLSLAVAGALILSPERWSPGQPLDRSPFAFPAMVRAGPGDADDCQAMARDWGARLLSVRLPGPILSDPAVVDMINHRTASLLRA